VISILKKASSEVEYIVVASITGDSAINIANEIENKKIICVTCPQE